MSSLCTVLLALGVVSYIFEYTLEIGATQPEMGGKKIMKIAGVYSLVQMGMLLLGAAAIAVIRVVGMPVRGERGIQILILAVLLWYAFSCMKMAVRGSWFEEHREKEPDMKNLVMRSALAGVKTAVIGMAVWCISRQAWSQTVLIWVVTFLAAVSGLAYGYWYGPKWSRQICFGGGIFLLASSVILVWTG